MPASSRSSSSLSSTFIVVGTCALLVLIVVVITGGFVIDVGPLHLSARRWRRPLVVALAAWTSAAWLCRRTSLADRTASIGPWIERHAPAAAILIGAAAAGVGVAFGTYSASGSDAAGYLSQAELIASVRIVQDEPLARQVGWPEATWAFSPLGYRPGLAPGEIVPTYPPGLPLTMAASRVAGEWGPFTVVPLTGALAVLCTYALGARLHSRSAGVVAAALLATSPIFLFQVVQPMSDVPVTAWWALALLLALSAHTGSAVAAGAAAGFALLTRPNLLPLAIAVAVLSALWPRMSGSQPRVTTNRLWAFVAGVTPAVLALMLLQWRIYGSPAASGYGSFEELFAFSNVWPNARDYAWRLLRGEGSALLLAALSFAVILVSRRARQAALQSVVRPAGVAAVFAATVLVCYLPYAVFADWSYLRFFLPAFPAAFVATGALLASASAVLPRPARGLMLLVVITAAASVNVTLAAGEQAFNLRRYEKRYRDTGRYLDTSLPPEAVVFAVQQSASARHYTGRPVVRWDLLRVDLDSAVSTLTMIGRRPVLLVEDWERADLRARFPSSGVAALDWQPRADVGGDTHVRLFDPADRGTPPDQIATDRLP